MSFSPRLVITCLKSTCSNLSPYSSTSSSSSSSLSSVSSSKPEFGGRDETVAILVKDTERLSNLLLTECHIFISANVNITNSFLFQTKHCCVLGFVVHFSVCFVWLFLTVGLLFGYSQTQPGNICFTAYFANLSSSCHVWLNNWSGIGFWGLYTSLCKIFFLTWSILQIYSFPPV